MLDHNLCPCGSGRLFADCCSPFVTGITPAPSSGALMRSRYTAYVVKNTDYLLATWHPSTRPAAIDPATIPCWTHLDVVREEECNANQSLVEFIARASSGGRVLVLHEISRFVRENDRWYYIDGEISEAPATTAARAGRNSPCPCGSGKKFKKCCGP
ncbi:MAG: YchJ family protein [Thermodesulfobacteriota bacterium]